jgi:uncharacterized protein (TIGR02596 family)
MEQMMKPLRPGHRTTAAFTLIELLVVVALMLIFLSLAVPAVNSVLAGVNLGRGGQQIADQIMLGRQNALTRNRNVEVRFIQVDKPPTPGYRAVQIWMVDETGLNRIPISRMVTLPDGVLVSPDTAMSPLIFGDGATVSGRADFPSLGSCEYRGFRFRANGQTDIPTGSGTNTVNYVTLQGANDTEKPPRNFFAIQVNPLTGTVATFRP